MSWPGIIWPKPFWPRRPSWAGRSTCAPRRASTPSDFEHAGPDPQRGIHRGWRVNRQPRRLRFEPRGAPWYSSGHEMLALGLELGAGPVLVRRDDAIELRRNSF